MKFTTTVAAMAWSAPILIGAADPTQTAQVPRGTLNMGEWNLREFVTAAPAPRYPEESLRNKVSGVAVARVVFGLDGRAHTAEILEAPDAATAAAVRQAVSRWTVPGQRGADRDGDFIIQGKVTFYFQIRAGKGVVLDADQMPGGSPRPKRAAPVATSASGVPHFTAPLPPPPVPGSHGETLHTITASDFRKQAVNTQQVVLDSGERDAFKRGHWPGAVNIPFDELAVRAGPELPRDRLIVVDCTREEMQVCRWAGGRLVEQKFPNVVLLVR